jgi:hypothetical protein
MSENRRGKVSLCGKGIPLRGTARVKTGWRERFPCLSGTEGSSRGPRTEGKVKWYRCRPCRALQTLGGKEGVSGIRFESWDDSCHCFLPSKGAQVESGG